MTPSDYGSGETGCQGFFYQHPPGSARPFVIVYHEYMGIQPFILQTAEDLFSLGANVLVADLYGRDLRPCSHEEAYPLYRQLKDNPDRLRNRALLAVTHAQALQGQGHPGPLVLLGYSLGGAAALAAARACDAIDLTILVYSHLLPGRPGRTRPFSGNLLVFHGILDSIVPFDHLVQFVISLEFSGVDTELVLYAGAGHGFCNPSQPNDPERGAGFHDRYRAQTWKRIADTITRLTPGLETRLKHLDNPL